MHARSQVAGEVAWSAISGILDCPIVEGLVLGGLAVASLAWVAHTMYMGLNPGMRGELDAVRRDLAIVRDVNRAQDVVNQNLVTENIELRQEQSQLRADLDAVNSVLGLTRESNLLNVDAARLAGRRNAQDEHLEAMRRQMEAQNAEYRQQMQGWFQAQLHHALEALEAARGPGGLPPLVPAEVMDAEIVPDGNKIA